MANFNFNTFLWMLVSLFSVFSCNSDEYNSPIPDVHVNFQIDLNDPRYLDLNPFGGHIYVANYGNRGLVIYHNFNDTYSCFDRTCSYESSSPCAKVEIDENNFFLQCGQTKNKEFEPCCGSKFSWEGFPLDGPAIYPLKEYLVYHNANLLTITN